jgi:Xaa-Pro dipeptidase
MAKQIANPDLPAPPSGKYPAKSHSRRVAKWLAENGGPTEGVIYLEGQALREHEVGDFSCLVHVWLFDMLMMIW